MARNQISDRPRSAPKVKDNNGKINSKRKSNGKKAIKKEEAAGLVVPSSSSDSQMNHAEGKVEEALEACESEEEGESQEQGEDDGEIKEEGNSGDDEKEAVENKNGGEKKKKKQNQNKKDDKNKSTVTLNRFPSSRVNRIIRSENPDIRLSAEAGFLVNKASEKFLELFCKEAYASAFLDRKSYVGYGHLSSAVSKRKRLDFLSDFVPEKVKAEDALVETSVADES